MIKATIYVKSDYTNKKLLRETIYFEKDISLETARKLLEHYFRGSDTVVESIKKVTNERTL